MALALSVWIALFCTICAQELTLNSHRAKELSKHLKDMSRIHLKLGDIQVGSFKSAMQMLHSIQQKACT